MGHTRWRLHIVDDVEVDFQTSFDASRATSGGHTPAAVYESTSWPTATGVGLHTVFGATLFRTHCGGLQADNKTRRRGYTESENQDVRIDRAGSPACTPQFN